MYNGDRFNYDENNINQLKFVDNYLNNKRAISPRIVEDPRMRNYYFNQQNPNNNILYKNININEELLNAQYQNYSNPIHFIQHQNPLYSDYIPNNYYPNPNQQNIYYEQIIPANNNYIYRDGNLNNNYFPQLFPHSQNNRISKNGYIFEKNKEENINNSEVSNNGVKLSISNCQTQYPMTYLSNGPFKKIKRIIQNYNSNNNNDINDNIINNKEPINPHLKNSKRKN